MLAFAVCGGSLPTYAQLVMVSLWNSSISMYCLETAQNYHNPEVAMQFE
jgi:hypothetical protein